MANFFFLLFWTFIKYFVHLEFSIRVNNFVFLVFFPLLFSSDGMEWYSLCSFILKFVLTSMCFQFMLYIDDSDFSLPFSVGSDNFAVLDSWNLGGFQELVGIGVLALRNCWWKIGVFHSLRTRLVSLSKLSSLHAMSSS